MRRKRKSSRRVSSSARWRGGAVASTNLDDLHVALDNQLQISPSSPEVASSSSAMNVDDDDDGAADDWPAAMLVEAGHDDEDEKLRTYWTSGIRKKKP
tara:strand:- start:291 stop:584 length:294 start_codon:yes stop_codon:yes gene_type:complete